MTLYQQLREIIMPIVEGYKDCNMDIMTKDLFIITDSNNDHLILRKIRENTSYEKIGLLFEFAECPFSTNGVSIYITAYKIDEYDIIMEISLTKAILNSETWTKDDIISYIAMFRTVLDLQQEIKNYNNTLSKIDFYRRNWKYYEGERYLDQYYHFYNFYKLPRDKINGSFKKIFDKEIKNMLLKGIRTSAVTPSAYLVYDLKKENAE